MTTSTNVIDNTALLSPLSECEDYYSLSEHDGYFTKDNLYEGMTGEKVVTDSLRTKFKAKDGYMLKHNPFGKQYEYSCGIGVDVKVYDGCKELAQIEVKNLSQQQKPYGTDFVRKKVLPRFSHNGGGLKLFVITFLSLLTKLAVQLLEQEGITIIEVGERLTSEFYRDLKKLYVLGNTIHKTITSFWQRKVQPKSRPFFGVVNALDHYVVPVNAPNIPINSNNLTNITTNTHDTVTNNYNQIMRETVENSHKLWLKERERLRKLHRF